MINLTIACWEKLTQDSPILASYEQIKVCNLGSKNDGGLQQREVWILEDDVRIPALSHRCTTARAESSSLCKSSPTLDAGLRRWWLACRWWLGLGRRLRGRWLLHRLLWRIICLLLRCGPYRGLTKGTHPILYGNLLTATHAHSSRYHFFPFHKIIDNRERPTQKY